MFIASSISASRRTGMHRRGSPTSTATSTSFHSEAKYPAIGRLRAIDAKRVVRHLVRINFRVQSSGAWAEPCENCSRGVLALLNHIEMLMHECEPCFVPKRNIFVSVSGLAHPGHTHQIQSTQARLWGLIVGQPGGRSYLQRTKCRK